MRPVHRAGANRDGIPAAAIILAALSLVLAAPSVPLAQPAADSQPVEQQPSDPESGAPPSDGEPLTFLDSVTVSATLRPTQVLETPGTVTVMAVTPTAKLRVPETAV